MEVYSQTLIDNPAHERLISGVLATPTPVVLDTDRADAVQKMFEALAVPTHQIQHLMDEGIFTCGQAHERALVLWVAVHGILQLRKMEDVSQGRIRVGTLLDETLRTLVSGWSRPTQTEHRIHHTSKLND